MEHSETLLSVTEDELENFDKDLDVNLNDNNSCWMQLAHGISMVELADLANSPGGDEGEDQS